MGFRDGEGESKGLSGMRERMMLLFLFYQKSLSDNTVYKKTSLRDGHI